MDTNEPDKEANDLYESFWKPIIEENGIINLDQLKKELYDFHFLMDNASKVYSHVTGNMLSKTTYFADSVIRAADDYITKLCNEAREEGRKDCNCPHNPETDGPY